MYPIIGREADKRGHYNFNTRAGNPTNFWTDSDSCEEYAEKKRNNPRIADSLWIADASKLF